MRVRSAWILLAIACCSFAQADNGTPLSNPSGAERFFDTGLGTNGSNSAARWEPERRKSYGRSVTEPTTPIKAKRSASRSRDRTTAHPGPSC